MRHIPIPLVRYQKFILISLVMLGLFLTAYSFFDPDFPWHVRNGLEIIEGKFSLTDQYSYTMPSFPYVNHSWLSSVIWAILYYKLHLGYLGVSIFCAVIAAGAAVISSNGLMWIIPLVAASYLDGGDVRTNVMTFLFLPLLILLLIKAKTNTKILFTIPFLIWGWANLHGGFLIGIIYLWGFIVVDIYLLDRKINTLHKKLHYTLMGLFALTATIITPYKLGTWVEALRTINNPLLKAYVSEWQPLYRLPSFSFLLIVTLFLMVLFWRKKLRWIDIFCVLLLADSFLSVRMAPLFCASAGFVISHGYQEFVTKLRDRIDADKLKRLLQVCTIGILLLFCLETSINVRNRVILQPDAYPSPAALQFIEDHPPQGNVFSLVHWNSYLLWKIPSIKVFLDGRMLVWQQPSKNGELENAFETFTNITILKTSFEPIANSFCITTVLWNRPEIGSVWIFNTTWKDITKTLNQSEWKQVYSDYNAVIFERPLPNGCKSR